MLLNPFQFLLEYFLYRVLLCLAGLGGLGIAPIFLAGLSPNSIIAAAAPIGCICTQECFLQSAIKNYFCVNDSCDAMTKMNNGNKLYIAQNDSTILNGTYDMQGIVIPTDFYEVEKLKVNICLAGTPYGTTSQKPDVSIGLYKDISQANLRRKFETQQFMRGYMMRKYEIPLFSNYADYANGIQKLSSEIDLKNFENKTEPLQIVVKYTEGGFRKNQAVENPKAHTYAYLVEIEKIK